MEGFVVVEDADVFEKAIIAFLEHGAKKALMVLEELQKADPVPPYNPSAVAAGLHGERKNSMALKLEKRVEIYRNDGWRCRYCSRKLVVPGILQLLTTLCNGFLGLQPGHHMPAAATEPAVWRVYPNVDHFIPLAAGGSSGDDNLVTACTPCNTKKNAYPGWVLGERVLTGWDGLTSLYPRLLERSTKYHKDWLEALDKSTKA